LVASKKLSWKSISFRQFHKIFQQLQADAPAFSGEIASPTD